MVMTGQVRRFNSIVLSMRIRRSAPAGCDVWESSDPGGVTGHHEHFDILKRESWFPVETSSNGLFARAGGCKEVCSRGHGSGSIGLRSTTGTHSGAIPTPGVVGDHALHSISNERFAHTSGRSLFTRILV